MRDAQVVLHAKVGPGGHQHTALLPDGMRDVHAWHIDVVPHKAERCRLRSWHMWKSLLKMDCQQHVGHADVHTRGYLQGHQVEGGYTAVAANFLNLATGSQHGPKDLTAGYASAYPQDCQQILR